MAPFHKKSMAEWHAALQSDSESKTLIQELVMNCGYWNLENDVVWRGRINLKPEEVSAEGYDAPPLEAQQVTFNRFQPKTTNCVNAGRKV